MLIKGSTILSLVSIIAGFIEGLISLRIILKLLGANISAPFVAWVYETSTPLLSPFEGMFPSPEIQGGFVIEISALFALLAYSFLSYLLTEAVSTLESRKSAK